MPEWLTDLLKIALGGGLVTVAGLVAKLLSQRHRHRRQSRGDEITELYKIIADLKRDRDEMKRDLADLKDKHTACLLAEERMRGRVRYLELEVVKLGGTIRWDDGDGDGGGSDDGAGAGG